MSLKIGILGTRGIPNNYGGFEQCAAQISKRLVLNGHEVFVYCTHHHPYQDSEWEGVRLIHKYEPQSLGTFGQFIYDRNCLRDATKQSFDVLLQLGYTSNAIWYSIWPSNCPNVFNMDGLEWKRSKYHPLIRKFLMFSEGIAAQKADSLISDSIGIQDYLKNKYKKASTYIPYGAIPFENANPSLLPKNLKATAYHLLIARMEKENNIELVLEGFLKSSSKKSLVLVGNVDKSYGRQLHKKYSAHDQIVFTGGIYDEALLNNLRYYSHLYFHGHSVGGTNPSLLEAMASRCMIIAHQNPFNEKILGTDAHYFNSRADLSNLIDKLENEEKNSSFVENNLEKIKEIYSWEAVTQEYESALIQATEEFKTKKK